MGSARIDPKTKAAVIAELVAGEQPAVIADKYKVNRQTVKAWKQRLQPELKPDIVPQAPTSYAAVEARKRQIGELVLDLLAAKLEASEAIAKAASSPEWLAKQSGSELAALGGWLDATAFAIGDRLAQRPGDAAQQPDD